MRPFLKLLLIVGIVAAVTIFAFLGYTFFLVDYSLDNLQAAITATEKDNLKTSSLTNHLYSSIVQDLAIEQVTKDEKANVKDFVLLKMASQSFQEAQSRDGYKRAKIYLDQVAKGKESERSMLLKASDGMRQHLEQWAGSFRGIGRYFRKRITTVKKKSTRAGYATEVVLTQAQILDKNGNFEEAANLYRKFLSNNPGHPSRGLVSIALANILMKRGRLQESRAILVEVQKDYPGLEEGALAGRFLRKIDYMKKGMDLIPRLKTLAATEKDARKRDQLRLKLALAHISLYQLEQAQKNLEQIQGGNAPEIQSQAKFYLGWVYKLRNQYGDSEKVLMDLLDDPELAGDLELGLHVELADIYSSQKNSAGALAHYQAMVNKIQKELDQVKQTQQAFQEKKALNSAWSALAELQQSSVYLYDFQDLGKARQHLNNFNEILSDNAGTISIEKIREGFSGVSTQSLRERAFHALESRQVGLSYDFFMQNMAYQPSDSWTYAGLSTIYVLMGDLESALQYAQKGYSLGQDEYTASALGYVYGLAGRYQEALGMYERASQSGGDYLPAKFNLGWMHLKLEQYSNAYEIFNELDTDGTRLNYIIRAKILNNMGYALWKMGDRDKSKDLFSRSLKANPNFKVAEKNLSLSQQYLVNEKPV